MFIIIIIIIELAVRRLSEHLWFCDVCAYISRCVSFCGSTQQPVTHHCSGVEGSPPRRVLQSVTSSRSPLKLGSDAFKSRSAVEEKCKPQSPVRSCSARNFMVLSEFFFFFFLFWVLKFSSLVSMSHTLASQNTLCNLEINERFAGPHLRLPSAAQHGAPDSSPPRSEIASVVRR